MNLLFIVNPKAGKNKGAKAVVQAIPQFQTKGIQCEIKVSEYHGHAIQLASEINPAKYDGVIAVGGDGTLFEVLNGLLKKHPNFELPIGQIPVGSGNSFIKDLGINSVEDAVDKISGGKTCKVDVGFFKYPDGEHYFINLLGAGFVANVAHTAGKYRIFGALNYIIGVFEELIGLKSVPVELTIDGKVYQRDYIFAEICNSTKTGGDMIMAPDASINDGLLDIIILNKISRIGLLKIFPSIFKGTHVLDSHVEVFKGKSVKIVTEKPQRLVPDGEVFGATPIEVSILPRKINMFC